MTPLFQPTQPPTHPALQASRLVAEADARALRAEKDLPLAEKAAQHAEAARSAQVQVGGWVGAHVCRRAAGGGVEAR